VQIALEAEITTRQGQAAHELQQLDRELMGLDGERRKLLEAYYADAIDLHLLRQEQTRISQRTSTLEVRRRSLTANLNDWRTILEAAGRFATNRDAAYRYVDPPTRKLFNNAVIDRIELRDGQIAHVDYRAPFDLLFNRSGFEYRTVVELRGFEPLTSCLHAMAFGGHVPVGNRCSVTNPQVGKLLQHGCFPVVSLLCPTGCWETAGKSGRSLVSLSSKRTPCSCP
jgi:hypothetical protein